MKHRRLLGFSVVVSLMIVVLTWAVYLTGVGTSRLLFSRGNTSYYLRDDHFQAYEWNANGGCTLFEMSVFSPLIACGLLWLCWTLYRARRHLFTIGAAASLLISIALLAEWSWERDRGAEAGLRWIRELSMTAGASSLNCGLFSYEIWLGGRKGLPGPGNPPILMVYVPYWAISLPFMITPGLWLRRHRRRRSQTWQSCDVCSYNLTANTSGICPECGTPIVGSYPIPAPAP